MRPCSLRLPVQFLSHECCLRGLLRRILGARRLALRHHAVQSGRGTSGERLRSTTDHLHPESVRRGRPGFVRVLHRRPLHERVSCQRPDTGRLHLSLRPVPRKYVSRMMPDAPLAPSLLRAHRHAVVLPLRTERLNRPRQPERQLRGSKHRRGRGTCACGSVARKLRRLLRRHAAITRSLASIAV